jgi:hypothetical protein
MKVTHKQTITDEVVELDGVIFTDCVLTRCQLHFSGALETQFVNCKIIECRFLFSGPADRTMGLAKMLGWRPPEGWTLPVNAEAGKWQN